MTSPPDAATTLGQVDVVTGPSSFEEFFAEQRIPLARSVWLMARDRHEAEEIVQDSFVRVWEHWSHVSEHPDPTAYLYRTAINLLRSRRRRAALALRHAVRALPATDATEQVEDRDAAVRALGSLTPRERAAVVLVDVCGMTGVEAAKALGVKASTVRVLLGRGREKLRRELGEHE